jgi:hypothetical protein
MTKLSLRAPLLAACACLWIASGARAQAPTSNKIAAEALFDRGLTLMQQGKYAEACPQLEQSQELESGIGTMLYLAECYERLGRVASAWALFREASSSARAEGQSERAQVGATRAAALEPRLPKLTVRVDAVARVPELEIARNGQTLASSLYGLEVPVDPGEHQIDARAPGKHPWSKRVAVTEGLATVVEVPALEDAPASTAAPVQPAGGAARAGFTDSDADASSGPTQRLAGIVVGAAGVVAIAVGAVFGGVALSKKGDADERCEGAGTGSECADARGVALNDEAQDAATLSNIFFIGGAALAVTGVVLYVTAPSDDEASTTVALRSNGLATSLSLEGAF